MNSVKKLVVLDFDNTLFDALGRWEICLGRLMDEFSRANDISLEIVDSLVREAHGQHRFNDGAALVDAIIEADPQLHQKALSKENAGIKKAWLDDNAKTVTFYDGVLNALKFWQRQGVRCVIETDCEQVAVYRNLWYLGVKACKRGDLQYTCEVLDFFDKIYCQPGIQESKSYLSEVENDFITRAKGKTHVWEDRTYKPSADHMAQILFDCDVPAENAIYIGDSYKDGAEAATVSPPVDFVWAAYGTNVNEEVLGLYARVGSKSFTYGMQSIKKIMKERDIVPAQILKAELSEVLALYDWELPAPIRQMTSSVFPQQNFDVT
ncbi:MAG: hypothetical protein IAE63_08770 [Alphaproteobacteria bacterium]|nr:hypothetical protein [Alphaproteobacteria bacterium]